MKKVQFLLLAMCLSLGYVNAQTNWVTSGNTGTSGNFLGTTSGDFDILFKRNNIQSGLLNTSNTSWGVGALNPSSTGTQNIAFGAYALVSNSSGTGNTALGFNTLYYNTTGYLNTAIGANSMLDNLSGYSNVASGVGALSQNTTGYQNVASGVNALQLNVGGINNTAIGYMAGSLNSSGGFNTFLGMGAGGNATTGSGNTFVGVVAGAGITTGSSNTIIGPVPSGTPLPSTLAGTVILADGNGTYRLYIDNNGHAGFGGFTPSALPTATLEVKSGTTGASGLKFTNLTNASTAITSSTNAKTLSVDASGNVILIPGTVIHAGTNTGITGLGTTTSPYVVTSNITSLLSAGSNISVSGSGTSGSPYVISAPSAGLWTTSGTSNIINTNTGGVIIGTGITSFPTGYSLYVANGILAERVKIAVKNSTNWADYVFDKDYKLQSLDSVENYINTNKHLPDMPSADELVKDGGVDVTQMLAKQMEKTEELTLYIIKLNKEIEELKKESKKNNKR